MGFESFEDYLDRVQAVERKVNNAQCVFDFLYANSSYTTVRKIDGKFNMVNIQSYNSFYYSVGDDNSIKISILKSRFSGDVEQIEVANLIMGIVDMCSQFVQDAPQLNIYGLRDAYGQEFYDSVLLVYNFGEFPSEPEDMYPIEKEVVKQIIVEETGELC